MLKLPQFPSCEAHTHHSSPAQHSESPFEPWAQSLVLSKSSCFFLYIQTTQYRWNVLGPGGGTRAANALVMGSAQSHVRGKYLAFLYRYHRCSLLAPVVNPHAPQPRSSRFLRLKSELDMLELIRNNLPVCHWALEPAKREYRTKVKTSTV